MKREKTKIKSNIILIYDSKLKYNDIGLRITMKTHNLNRSRARIDPIDRWIKGFLFCNFEDEIRHSRGNFSLFFLRNLYFKHSLDAEMSLEEEEMKRFKD